MNLFNKEKIIKVFLKLEYVINKYLYLISPVISTKFKFRIRMKKNLNLKNPQTFNEKLQWLKLYWQHPLVTKCADKLRVSEYLEMLDLNHLVNEVYGVYNTPEDIPFNELPQKFVIKCNHGCGFNIICRDKSKIDIENTKKVLSIWLKTRYAFVASEVQYDKMIPTIYIEKYLESKDDTVPVDYKIYCFNGIPEFTLVCDERFKGKAKYYYYNNDWKKLPYDKESNHNSKEFVRPLTHIKMLEYAKILAKPFPFVRIDFYDIEGKIILGEMTFTPSACLDKDYPEAIDLYLGSKIMLPPKYEIK